MVPWPSRKPERMILEQFSILSGKADCAVATKRSRGYVFESATLRVVGTTEAR